MVPTECPRITTDTPMSLSVAVNVDFRGYPQVLHWHYSTPLKSFQMVNSEFTVEITDLHSATERKSRGACFLNLELLIQT